MKRVLCLIALLGCGKSDTERLDPGRKRPDAGTIASGDDAGAIMDAELDAGLEADAEVAADAATDAGVMSSIACGDTVCAEGAVCAAYWDGSFACFARGEEPSFENGPPDPWPSVLLYCDGDEDCPSGRRCVLNVGEIYRADCLEEEPDSCGFHAGHICESDADCHSCPNPGDPDRPMVCRPATITGATHLSTCTWAN